MQLIDNQILTWDDIKSQNPDEWVVIANPIFDGMKLLKGIVLAHRPYKRVASIEGGEKREGFKKLILSFTGHIKSNSHIGFLRTSQKPLLVFVSIFHQQSKLNFVSYYQVVTIINIRSIIAAHIVG